MIRIDKDAKTVFVKPGTPATLLLLYLSGYNWSEMKKYKIETWQK